MSYNNNNNMSEYFKSPYQIHNEKEKQFERDIKRHQHHIQLLQNQNTKLKQDKYNSESQYQLLLHYRDTRISQLYETNNYLSNQIKQIQRNEKYSSAYQLNRIKYLESQQYESTLEICKLKNELNKLKHEKQELRQKNSNLKLQLFNINREKDLKFKNLLIDNQKSLNKLKQFEINQIEQLNQINQIRNLLNVREEEYQLQRNQDYQLNNEKLFQVELKLKQEKQKSINLKKSLIEIDMEFFKIVLNFEQEIVKRNAKEKSDQEIINNLKVKLSNFKSSSTTSPPSPFPSTTNDKLERERKEKELRNTLLKQKQDAERKKENDKIIQKLKQRELQRRIEKEKSDELLRKKEENERLQKERERERDKLEYQKRSSITTPRVSIGSTTSTHSSSTLPLTSQQLEIIKRIEYAKKPNDIFQINLNELKSIDTINNLKTLYRQYSKLIHPDKCLKYDPENFHKLKEAFDIISGDLLISLSMHFSNIN